MKTAWLAAALLALMRHASADGLAARYPGDAGIAGDPDVLFAESFAETSIAALAQQWSM